MKLVKSACALLVFFSSVPGYATTITFATRPAFNAAAPGLPIETFESGLVAPGATVTTCTGPLSSAAGSACFAVETLLPGAIYSASPPNREGFDPGGLAVIAAGFLPPLGNASKVLGPTLFSDTFDISLPPPRQPWDSTSFRDQPFRNQPRGTFRSRSLTQAMFLSAYSLYLQRLLQTSLGLSPRVTSSVALTL